MTAYTKTVSNQLGIVGLGYPVYWGTAVWGTDVWGSAAPAFAVAKAYVSTMTVSSTEQLSVVWDRTIVNSMAVSSTIDLSATFDRVINNDCDLTSDVGKGSTRNIANDLTVESAQQSVYVLNGLYYRVFPGGVTNALSAVATSFVTNATSTTWAAASKPTTVWS